MRKRKNINREIFFDLKLNFQFSISEESIILSSAENLYFHLGSEVLYNDVYIFG